MAEQKWSIELIQKKDLRSNPQATEEALNVIKAAGNDELLILSNLSKSPDKIMKAAVYNKENLVELIKYTESQASRPLAEA